MQTSIFRKPYILLTALFVLMISTAALAAKPADTSDSSTFTVKDVTTHLNEHNEILILEEEFLKSYDKDKGVSYGIHSVNAVQNGKKIVFEYDYSKPESQLDPIDTKYIFLGEHMVRMNRGFSGEVVLRVYEEDRSGPKKFVLIKVLPEEKASYVKVRSSLPQPTLQSAKNKKKGRVTVKWKALSAKEKKKIEKFEIICAQVGGPTKTWYIDKDKTSAVLEELEKGKTYRIRMRTRNGKKASKWSKDIKLKIRK